MNEQKHRKRDLVDRFMLFLNALTLMALIPAYLAGSFSPEEYWPLAFAAMAYPILLAMVVTFILYWLLRRKWFLFLNIAFLVLKWDYVQATVQFNPKAETTETEGVKVMTYNVRLFDRFNWTKNKNTSSMAYDFIYKQQPDILCIQEFYVSNAGSFKTLDTLLESNSIRHMYVENYTSKLKDTKFWGMATLTAYPIVSKGKIQFEGTTGNLCIYTDLLIHTDTVRVYNVHLQSIRLGNQGYKVLDKIVADQQLEDVNEGKLVISRMKNGFIRRARQADLVAEHISQSPYKVILCGDFNDVPTSYAYQVIAKGLKDSFSQKGHGIGNTYATVPFFRIDNVLYSPEFVATSHTVHPYKLSDHLAVTTTLRKVN